MDFAKCEEFLLEFVRAKLPRDLRRHLGVSDIVQSVLYTVSRQRETFRGTTEAEFRAWVCQIARHKIIDGIRRFRARHIPATVAHSGRGWARQDEADLETPSGCVSLEEDAQRLIHAIGQLPADVRRIVTLRYAQGLTFEQIGLEMQLPTSTCRRRWLEGCQILQQQLHGLLE